MDRKEPGWSSGRAESAYDRPHPGNRRDPHPTPCHGPTVRICVEKEDGTGYVKNVPGRKSDVSDCQWLQYLHSVGLLRGSFRPEQAVCTVRSILRHRDSLVQMASSHVPHMQKALDQMNLQLHHVISDITGVTGLTIIEPVLAGERNPHTLAALRDG